MSGGVGLQRGRRLQRPSGLGRERARRVGQRGTRGVLAFELAENAEITSLATPGSLRDDTGHETLHTLGAGNLGEVLGSRTKGQEPHIL